MAIYDIDGNSIPSAFGSTGNELSSAYDLSGGKVFPGTYDLVVMTYNVQWFTGINSQLAMQQKIINDNNADIIGLQELTQNGTISQVGVTALSPYQYQQISNHKNYIGMASKLPLSNIVVADYVNQSPSDMSQWNETRAYMMADISVGGKTITWFNTHLSVDQDYKYLQMGELFDLMQMKEYAIATGDFNISDYETISDSKWINMIKQFSDAGYNVANNRTSGHTNTYTGATSATSLAEFTKPHDDIITSGNISIESVKFDTTKLSYLNGSSIDHIPIIACLEIN